MSHEMTEMGIRRQNSLLRVVSQLGQALPDGVRLVPLLLLLVQFLEIQ